MIRGLAALVVATGFTSPALAVSCETVTFDGSDYTLCEVDPRAERIELFLRDAQGEILGQFLQVDAELGKRGETLVFAMNAGMYHEDRAPVGHYVEDGVEAMRVIANPGPGNFGLLPNGIFCVRGSRADVFETLDFLDKSPACDHATQSGPMLVIDGALHPRFLADGTSLNIRNGVGTSADGTRVVFAISDDPVNFHSFGLFFRDFVGVPNALFLDGSVSRLFAPEIGRNDFGFALGPIVGVVAPAE